jgi:hypothetical protein
VRAISKWTRNAPRVVAQLISQLPWPEISVCIIMSTSSLDEVKTRGTEVVSPGNNPELGPLGRTRPRKQISSRLLVRQCTSILPTMSVVSIDGCVHYVGISLDLLPMRIHGRSGTKPAAVADNVDVINTRRPRAESQPILYVFNGFTSIFSGVSLINRWL